MYEMYERTCWNVARDSMLHYTIDTYGGNSGSPVLTKGTNKAIGVHVQGGRKNKATIIGKYGNPFPSYIAAFKAKGRPAHTNQGPKAKNFHLITLHAPGRPMQGKRVEAGTDDELNNDEVVGEDSFEAADAVSESIHQAFGSGMSQLGKMVP